MTKAKKSKFFSFKISSKKGTSKGWYKLSFKKINILIIMKPDYRNDEYYYPLYWAPQYS